MSGGTIQYGGGCGRSHFVGLCSPALCNSKFSRRLTNVIKVIKDDSTHSNAMRAFLSAEKQERVKLPDYRDRFGSNTYHISRFLNHPNGIEAVLNVNALEEYELLDSDTYRCKLPAIQLFNIDVAPVLYLRVTPSNEDCTVELLSCKFEGSDTVEIQNRNYSASMTNYISWGQEDSEPYMDINVNLKIAFEINRLPSLLPMSVVEVTGNVVMQAVLDRYVPLLLQQILRDYENWVKQQPISLP